MRFNIKIAIAVVAVLMNTFVFGTPLESSLIRRKVGDIVNCKCGGDGGKFIITVCTVCADAPSCFHQENGRYF